MTRKLRSWEQIELVELEALLVSERHNRPSRSIALALVHALQDAGIRRVRRLDDKALYAAQRVGVPVREWIAARDRGEKWCSACRVFHPKAAFRGASGYCGEELRKYERERSRARRAR